MQLSMPCALPTMISALCSSHFAVFGAAEIFHGVSDTTSKKKLYLCRRIQHNRQ